MSTDNKILGSKLCSLLQADSKHKKTVLEIEAALAIDDDFPAVENIIYHLLRLLSHDKLSRKQQQWHDALVELYTEGGFTHNSAVLSCHNDLSDYEQWLIYYRGDLWGSPLAGKVDTYPIAAFFSAENETIAYGLAPLLLNALLETLPEHQLNTTTALLHKWLCYDHQIEDPAEESLLGKLPNYHDCHYCPDEYLKALKHFSDSLPEESNSEVIRIIRYLLKFSSSPKPHDLVTLIPQEKTPTAFLGYRKTAPDEKPGTGELVVHKLNISRSIDNESPELIDLFSASQDEYISVNSAGNTDDTKLATEEEIDQQSQESRYWLIRHEKIVPTDYGRFTMPERTKIIRFINDKIVSADRSMQIAAGLIGTMYITGLTLENLLNSSFGEDQTFKEAGGYRREIRMPREGFVPNEIQIEYIAPFTTELNLQLPEPIAPWVDNLYTPQRTLGQSLELELEDAKQHVYAALKILREKGRYQRIRAERIPAALAIETTLMFRDPVVTFLLASKSTQGAPKLSYYVTQSAEKLAQYYNQVTKEMVSL